MVSQKNIFDVGQQKGYKVQKSMIPNVYQAVNQLLNSLRDEVEAVRDKKQQNMH